MSIPRPEYPNPQFARADWMNLNGTWQFEMDPGRSGEDRKLYEADSLSGEIVVPFCPESKLSGVGYTDFIPAVWYRRTVSIPADKLSGRVFLHFGAVDYEAVIYVNGKEVGSHKGGYVHFSFDVTGFVHAGENVIAVYASDDARDGLIASGKQCFRYASMGCHYTRTTGIWQTVWLEFTPKDYVRSIRLFPNVEEGSVSFVAEVFGTGEFRAEASRFPRSIFGTWGRGICTI